ncbi:MAG: prolyl oligopeptidase family serine peptidase [Actinobacteria bacterium]|nr:prolyl oligopeptidase family serine peptidase [Actinomycetota bacterium]
MRSTFLAATVAVAVTGLAVPATASPEARASATPAGGYADLPGEGPCHRPSWIAGTVEYCDGALVYRDYVYDDYGADTGQAFASSTGTLSRPAGDERYPVGAEATADLIDLTLEVVGDELRATFELNALYEPGQTIAALALDTDPGAATGGGAWPGLDVASDGWDVFAAFDEGDPETNLIVGTLPLPAGDTWRVQAATAQAADGNVMNVAFRGVDEQAGSTMQESVSGMTDHGYWWEDLQSDALHAGDISDFGEVVRVSDLTGGVTRAAAVGPGLHERVYTSAYTLPPGEGMSYTPIPGRGTGGASPTFAQNFHYFGKYQPYGIYLPEEAGPHGLQFVAHGSNQNHGAFVNQPGFQRTFAHDLDRVIAVPLARGPHGYWSDVSERDGLDVLADVLAHYAIDEDQLFMSGYSQGGYATFRMAQLYPHLFAGFITWVGFTGDAGNNPSGEGDAGLVTAGAIHNAVDYVGNLRHVPGSMIFGTADELVHVTSAEAMAQEFRARDFPYRYYQHPTGDHFVFAVADDWRKEGEDTRGRTRVERPARVVFRTDPAQGNPDYRILHDRAYWVSALRGIEEGALSVDLTSAGCGGSIPTVTAGRDAGTEPVPWVSDFHEVTGHRDLEQANRLQGTLANVASLTVDVAGACLTTDAVPYALTTDGPVTVTLTDGRVLTLAAVGEHTGTIPAAAGPAPAPADAGDTAADGPLPATGGGLALTAIGLLAGAAALRRR